MTIAPPILQKGDTIGIVTPGSPVSAEIIDSRVQLLYHLGFHVVLGEYVYRGGRIFGRER